MHGFQEESVVKNLSGVKEFIYVPARHCGMLGSIKTIDEAMNQDVDFNKKITEVEERLEGHYTETRDDFIVKTLEEYDTSDASTHIKKCVIVSSPKRMDYIDNFALCNTSNNEYYNDSEKLHQYDSNDASVYEMLKKLLDTTETAIADFQLINFEEKEESISSLKKQIKNCKNPMQLKELNQKLNAAYKKRKKKN